LIIKELAVEKGSGSPKTEKVGNLTLEQLAQVARMKMTGSYAKSAKTAAKEVLGTCVSMGVTIDGRDPREVQKDIDAGKLDNILAAAS
jgi:large subunit ribosomal protein L11